MCDHQWPDLAQVAFNGRSDRCIKCGITLLEAYDEKHAEFLKLLPPKCKHKMDLKTLRCTLCRMTENEIALKRDKDK